MADLLAIRVANHVVEESNAAHAGELSAARLERVFCTLDSFLGALLELALYLGIGGCVETAIGPVPVRIQDGWILAARRWRGRPIQVAAHIMPRKAGEENLLDGVAVADDLAVDDRLQRQLLGHRPEPIGEQHLFADFLATPGPVFLARRYLEGEVAVEVFWLAQPRVGTRRRFAAMPNATRDEHQQTGDSQRAENGLH